MGSKGNASSLIFLFLNFFFLTTFVSAVEFSCSNNIKNFGVCNQLLSELLETEVANTTLKDQCCSLIKDVVELEAAVCLCDAVKANILGNKDDPLASIKAVHRICNKKLFPTYKCT
ncbi:hypothetical protein ACSBR1_038507 [Camellia fascicularis]